MHEKLKYQLKELCKYIVVNELNNVAEIYRLHVWEGKVLSWVLFCYIKRVFCCCCEQN